MNIFRSSYTLLSVVICLLLFIGIASSEEIYGTWGTCPWTISENGTLTIYAGNGVDTNGVCPWREFNSIIDTVIIESDVILPADSSYLFNLYRCIFIDLSGADSTKTTSMKYIFAYPKILRIGKHFSFINQTNGTSMAYEAIDVPFVWETSNGQLITTYSIATERIGIEDTYFRFDDSHLSNCIELPEELKRIESEAFSGVTKPIILSWELEFIAEDAFSDESIILLNGACSDYTWQWMSNHPTLLFHFIGNG